MNKWFPVLILTTLLFSAGAKAGPQEDLLNAYQRGVDEAYRRGVADGTAGCEGAPPDTLPPELPPPTGEGCDDPTDCQYNNTRCISGGFWDGWCCDSPSNFQSLGAEGRMNHNANAYHRPPRLDKRTIRVQFDSKFDASWITNCAAPGQHLMSLWAAYGSGRTREEENGGLLRVDLSRQCSDGVDIVLQASTNRVMAFDTRINTRVSGAYVAGQWRTTIVTATYDPALGKVYGTIEYVGKGTKSFSREAEGAKRMPVWWNWLNVGNVDDADQAGANRNDFGVTFRNIICTVQ